MKIINKIRHKFNGDYFNKKANKKKDGKATGLVLGHTISLSFNFRNNWLSNIKKKIKKARTFDNIHISKLETRPNPLVNRGTPSNAQDLISEYNASTEQKTLRDKVIDKKDSTLKTEILQYSEQPTDYSFTLKSVNTSSAVLFAVGSQLHTASGSFSNEPMPAGKEIEVSLGKVTARAGEFMGVGAGIASSLHQGYQTEHALTKSSSKVMDLLSTITMGDILANRKRSKDPTKKVTTEEMQRIISKKLEKGIQKKTRSAGFTGTFAFGSLIAAFSFLFPPALFIAAAGVVAGLGITRTFESVNKKRMAVAVSGFFNKINSSKDKEFIKMKQLLLAKVHHCNEQFVNGLGNDKNVGNKINIGKAADKTLSAMTVLRSVLLFIRPAFDILKPISLGLGLITSLFSPALSGFFNYSRRNKSIESPEGVLMNSMIPNISSRKFPYFKRPEFHDFINRNKQLVADSLGLKKTASLDIMLHLLGSDKFYFLRKELQGKCVKEKLRRDFSVFSGIPVSSFLKLSDVEFEHKHGYSFKVFMKEKVSKFAYKDTLNSGFMGSLTMSTGILSLSIIPGVFFVAFPLSILTGVIGLGVTMLTARNEKNKFSACIKKAATGEMTDTFSKKYYGIQSLLCKGGKKARNGDSEAGA